ncbi:UDP-N-acetylmuramoyl-L-alanine--D-glutamate ligase [Agarivorans sp. TSD2052]|uniref:UDP-N-acetylmuramoyl-L-alanine--D-glutamate ligase n=1 Tax=Agarivorans sp. TSD2052 TaxID=2937286 RepID=UPI0020107DEB|nr:UDP-N-acetylmuramoyl-L-alanine--D-glutamate ligase [Agarivorans sp. TSD2052]UPW17943.1 UDP-N-acetylmuramoyl-L-alanine--D-glutamate ligase [Agarivorans sp. TSD2052]
MSKLQPQKRYAVVGLGASGMSSVRFLLSQGISPLICDTRISPPGLTQLADNLTVVCGELPLLQLLDCDVVIVSPGVALAHPVLQKIAEAGVSLIGDVELFCHYALAPIVAITGSNGKSTVTSLVGDMAKQAGINVAVGGNIGVPVLDLLADDVQLYVLELSSFQLETTDSLAACAATVLNISEDHMDRYQGLADYIAAKQKIYQHATTAIVNLDDADSQPHVNAKQVISFSLTSAGDYSLSDNQQQLMKGERVLLATEELPLVGTHNYANILAALALADAAGIALEACLIAIKQFVGLAHRCQLVSRKRGISWINDSKATNVGATIAALKGLVQARQQLWLIVGGDSKDGDLSELAGPLAAVAGVVAFGKDKQRFKDIAANTLLVDNLEQALTWCKQQAKSGDTVLLSPACASLDMYRNFENRGQHFCQLVEAL